MSEPTLTLALLTALVLGGCKSKSDPSAEEAEQAEPAADSRQAAVDPDLAKAVAAASAEKSSQRPDTTQGPPPQGIFEPGAADKQLRPGDAPIVSLGSEGAPPRVQLSAMQVQPGSKHPLGVKLSIRVGRNLVPTIDFRTVLAAPGAKSPAAQDDQPRPAAPIAVAIRVLGATFDPQDAQRLPPQERKLAAKFKDAQVAFQMAPNGASSGFRAQLKPGTDAGLARHIEALSEVLAVAMLPYPGKPVGKGAYWMATTRESYSGFDTVAYRLVKVESVEGDSVVLDVDIKRYAAESKLPATLAAPELKDMKLAAFQCQGKAKLVVRSGSPVPASGRVNMDLTVFASSAEGAAPPLPILQSRIGAELGGAPSATPGAAPASGAAN